jgi:hypothetical protein
VADGKKRGKRKWVLGCISVAAVLALFWWMSGRSNPDFVLELKYEIAETDDRARSEDLESVLKKRLALAGFAGAALRFEDNARSVLIVRVPVEDPTNTPGSVIRITRKDIRVHREEETRRVRTLIEARGRLAAYIVADYPRWADPEVALTAYPSSDSIKKLMSGQKVPGYLAVKDWTLSRRCVGETESKGRLFVIDPPALDHDAFLAVDVDPGSPESARRLMFLLRPPGGKNLARQIKKRAAITRNVRVAFTVDDTAWFATSVDGALGLGFTLGGQPGRVLLYNAIAKSGQLPCRLEKVKEEKEIPKEPK